MLALPAAAFAQQKPAGAPPFADPSVTLPKLASLVARPPSELADVVDRFASDHTVLNRRYDAPDSPAQRKRMRDFYTGWRARLREVEFDKVGQEGKVDYVLLDNYLIHQ